MVTSGNTCALCGLDAGDAALARDFDGEERRFCCAGCARVYQLAHENGLLEQIRPRVAAPPSDDWVLRQGQVLHFTLRGMWCASCATVVEQILCRQPGVLGAEVSFAAERGRLRCDPEEGDPLAALQLLGTLGYDARPVAGRVEKGTDRAQENLLLQLVLATACSMWVMTLYIEVLYPHYAAGDYGSWLVRRVQYAVWALATPLLFGGGLSFLQGARRALKAHTATMDTLVAMGTLSAYGYSAALALAGTGAVYFDSVGMITTFVVLGRLVERLGAAQARKDVHELLALQPEDANRRAGGDWERVPAADLAPEDVILVKPGERVPADAEVIEGEGAVDESLLTGESAPVSKAAGDALFAGTLLADAALVCRVTRAGEETRLAEITRRVEQTLADKPPIQRLADRAARGFTLAILVLAALTALGWHLAGAPPARGLLAAVAVLVVACPCSLGLATPLAQAIALGRAARAGILIRNPAVLETAAGVQRVLFDKTGTLTQGRMAVVEVAAAPPATDALVVRAAAAVEQFSEHPAARAITAFCREPLPVANGFRTWRGLGAAARVQLGPAREVVVGSACLVLGQTAGSAARSETGLEPKIGAAPAADACGLAAQAERCAARGDTVVWVAWDGAVAGFIALRDTPNPTAAAALRRLAERRIAAAMLSGDSPRTTAAVAAELGVRDYEGSCLPEAKAERVRDWQARGERVLVVGDGVNDAPALALADVSVTASGGAAVAGETSDAVLTRPDLRLVPWLVAFSQDARDVIRQNLFWALGYNAVAVPLAVSGKIGPIVAAVAMACSSVLVVASSLRLARVEPSPPGARPGALGSAGGS